MTPEDEEFNRIEREAKLRMEAVSAALDKKAQNARELGLDYEPAQQEPVARQYQNRDGVWKDFISEKHYKDTLEDGSWPIRNLYTSPPAQRTWVGLTDEKIARVVSLAGFAPDWVEAHIAIQIVRVLEAELKEMNT